MAAAVAYIHRNYKIHTHWNSPRQFAFQFLCSQRQLNLRKFLTLAQISHQKVPNLSPALFNMSYLTDSYISFTLKLESWQIFCSNSSIRSSTYGKKIISDFPPCGKMVIFVTGFVIFLKTSK